MSQFVLHHVVYKDPSGLDEEIEDDREADIFEKVANGSVHYNCTAI